MTSLRRLIARRPRMDRREDQLELLGGRHEDAHPPALAAGTTHGVVCMVTGTGKGNLRPGAELSDDGVKSSGSGPGTGVVERVREARHQT